MVTEKNRKKVVFEKIASDFNAKSDLKVSGIHCLRKWAKLEAKQKEIVDHNNKSGNGTRTWKYYAQMEDCIGGQCSVNPTFTLESSSSSVISDHGESSSKDDENLYVTPQKRRRLRPNFLQRNAEADPLHLKCLNFSGNIKPKKKRLKTKKLTILQEMNEEKKTFWSNFLEVMKTSKK